MIEDTNITVVAVKKQQKSTKGTCILLGILVWWIIVYGAVNAGLIYFDQVWAFASGYLPESWQILNIPAAVKYFDHYVVCLLLFSLSITLILWDYQENSHETWAMLGVLLLTVLLMVSTGIFWIFTVIRG